MTNFILGVASSIVATLVLILASRISLRWIWAFPRGVRFVRPDRHDYLSQIASLIRSNKRTLFFKGLTGYDIFSSELIRTALAETRIDGWDRVTFVLTEPSSPAFRAEPNPAYTSARLSEYQRVAVSYLSAQVFPNCGRKPNQSYGVCYVPESKSLVNMLVLDNDAFVFFRGFTKEEGPAAQVILHVRMQKCPPLVRDLILHVQDHYLRICTPSGAAHVPVLQSPGHGSGAISSAPSQT